MKIEDVEKGVVKKKMTLSLEGDVAKIPVLESFFRAQQFLYLRPRSNYRSRWTE